MKLHIVLATVDGCTRYFVRKYNVSRAIADTPSRYQ